MTDNRHTEEEKKRKTAGFTMVELLATTLILMVAAGLLAQTIELALKQYHKSTQQSEAQLLCSTVCNYISGELTYATFAKDATGRLVTQDGAVVFSDGAHNMGDDAYFMVQTKNGMKKVGTAENGVGRLVETSASYGGPDKSFDVAGGMENATSYPISGGGAYDIFVGMTMNMGSDGKSVVADVWTEDRNGTKLAEHKVRILPMEIESP